MKMRAFAALSVLCGVPAATSTLAQNFRQRPDLSPCTSAHPAWGGWTGAVIRLRRAGAVRRAGAAGARDVHAAIDATATLQLSPAASRPVPIFHQGDPRCCRRGR